MLKILTLNFVEFIYLFSFICKKWLIICKNFVYLDFARRKTPWFGSL